MAIVWELIDDHPTNDISINMNLIIVHHVASVSGQPCSLLMGTGREAAPG
jgi:hypothetical protein